MTQRVSRRDERAVDSEGGDPQIEHRLAQIFMGIESQSSGRARFHQAVWVTSSGRGIALMNTYRRPSPNIASGEPPAADLGLIASVYRTLVSLAGPDFRL